MTTWDRSDWLLDDAEAPPLDPDSIWPRVIAGLYLIGEVAVFAAVVWLLVIGLSVLG